LPGGDEWSRNRYLWEGGATLEEHSRRKHKILREYFARYLAVRCQLPRQARFRLAIAEGFAGGGRYSCGAPGSPIIFIEELCAATEAFNLKRNAERMASIDIECLLLLNDESRDAIEALKSHVEPLLADARSRAPRLHLQIQYLNQDFETVYPELKQALEQGRYRNVLFSLDQCGHSHVARRTLVDIMRSFGSAEIFYTFSIEALLAFLSQSEPQLVASQLGYLGVTPSDLGPLAGLYE
jgi:three-Cys-motif partner protein